MVGWAGVGWGGTSPPAPPPPPPPPGAPTFSLTDKAPGVVLAPGELTATGIPGYGGVRSYTAHSAGKYVWAWNGGPTAACGLVLASDSLTAPFSGAAGAYAVYHGNSTIYRNSAVVLALGSTGSLFAGKLDLDALKLWVYNYANNMWNNDVIGNQDPDLGIGGIPIVAGTYYLGFSGLDTDTTTFDFGVVDPNFNPWG